jgi:hypothetical protein
VSAVLRNATWDLILPAGDLLSLAGTDAESRRYFSHVAVGAVRRLCQPALDPSPQLPAGAAHAINAANGPALVADFVIVRPALAVSKDGTAKGKGHRARPGVSPVSACGCPRASIRFERGLPSTAIC